MTPERLAEIKQECMLKGSITSWVGLELIKRIEELQTAGHQFVALVKQDREITTTQSEMERVKQGMPVFIGFYVTAYQKRYGKQCRPDVGGKAQGLMRAILKDIPLTRACQLIQVYCQMDVKWFITKAHDIGTFRENLNVIGNALDTGQNPGGIDWSNFDWGIENK